MISYMDVVKRFGPLVAVDRLNLAIGKGEIFGLIGPDGAGKTTAIRMALDIMDPDAGEVRLQPGSKTGYVPQRFSLYGDLSVIQNIRLMASLYGVGKKEMRERTEAALELTGLSPFRDRLAMHLSGGMKQKLALSAGIIHRPDILMLDEPTTGVDPVSRRDFWRLVYQLNSQGATVFVSTPYMDEAELCTRVAFMQEGRITAIGKPTDLKDGYPYDIIELAIGSRDVKRQLAGCPVLDANPFGDRHHLVVADAETALPAIRAALEKGNLPFTLRQIAPTLEDVFVALAEGTPA